MAVDTSVFQTTGAVAKSGGAPTFYVKNKDGAIEEVEVPYDQFGAPLDGWYVLKIKGFSAPYDDESQYGQQKKIRVLAVSQGQNKRMFSFRVSIAKIDKRTGAWVTNVTTKSASGQMIGAARGKPITEGEAINFTDFIGMEFGAYVQQSVVTNDYGTTAYGDIRKDSWCTVAEVQAEIAKQNEVNAALAAKPSVFLDDDD